MATCCGNPAANDERARPADHAEFLETPAYSRSPSTALNDATRSPSRCTANCADCGRKPPKIPPIVETSETRAVRWMAHPQRLMPTGNPVRRPIQDTDMSTEADARRVRQLDPRDVRSALGPASGHHRCHRRGLRRRGPSRGHPLRRAGGHEVLTVRLPDRAHPGQRPVRVSGSSHRCQAHRDLRSATRDRLLSHA